MLKGLFPQDEGGVILYALAYVSVCCCLQRGMMPIWEFSITFSLVAFRCDQRAFTYAELLAQVPISRLDQQKGTSGPFGTGFPFVGSSIN